MLFFKRGKIPGAREWELRAKLGKNYKEVIEQLNQILSDLDIEVRRVDLGRVGHGGITDKEEEDARYLAVLKGTLSLREARMSGWRIDNLAAIAIAISYIVSKQGKASRSELEKVLSHKFGRWKSLTLLDVFLRNGYLAEDDSEMLSLGWRTKAEIDLRELMTLLSEARG
jgi:intein/homing endonuclease